MQVKKPWAAPSMTPSMDSDTRQLIAWCHTSGTIRDLADGRLGGTIHDLADGPGWTPRQDNRLLCQGGPGRR